MSEVKKLSLTNWMAQYSILSNAAQDYGQNDYKIAWVLWFVQGKTYSMRRSKGILSGCSIKCQKVYETWNEGRYRRIRIKGKFRWKCLALIEGEQLVFECERTTLKIEKR